MLRVEAFQMGSYQIYYERDFIATLLYLNFDLWLMNREMW